MSAHSDHLTLNYGCSHVFIHTPQYAERFAGMTLTSETHGAACHWVFFVSSSPRSLLSTLKNKELSPVIGQKGIQGTMPSSGQSPHSEHSPHTLRRGNQS